MSYSVPLYFVSELLMKVNRGGCDINLVYNQFLYKKGYQCVCIGGLYAFIVYIKFYIYIN